MRDPRLTPFNLEHSAKVIPFPASARVGEARRVARIFAKQRTDKARAAYWKRTFTIVGKRLADAGIDPSEAQRQLALFGKLVVGELGRIDWDAFQALLTTTDDQLVKVQTASYVPPK